MTQKDADYFKHVQEVKKQLDDISPTMCLAKWLQVSLHLTNGLTQSCYHPPTHQVSLEDLKNSPKALHNTKEKKLQRQQMKSGKRPSGCEYCWKVEDAPGNHVSDRFLRSSEHWAKNHYNEVVSNPYDYDINPRYVEVNFNHACNLKCAYCSPHISSSWAQEIDDYGPYPTITPHNDMAYLKQQGLMPIIKKGDNPYVEAFWKWWPELYQDIEVFRMTGGEPLIDKNTYKVIDWIRDHPRPDLELAITSNMCPPEKLMKRFLESIQHIVEEKKVKRFMLFPSIDTWGEQAEYLRSGLDFSLFWKNVNQYLEQVPEGFLTFIITMNSLSLPRLNQLLSGILELQKKHNKTYHRIFLDCPFLRYPSWLSLQTLPTEYYHYMDEAIDFMKDNAVKKNDLYGFREFWIRKMERTRAWMSQDQEKTALEKNRVNFYRFFNEFDQRRNTEFLTVFPEMKSFWELCKHQSEKWNTQ